MASDHTQQQSTDAERRARDLSLRRTHPPADVPGYDTQKFLGSGAYGEVWVAVDQNTQRRVAIKFYTHRGGVDWSLLSREVEKLAVLSADRYVVQLLDVGWDADPPYYVMDYIENGSLEDLLQREGPRPVDEAVELFREVAVGLVHLHGKGVLHCDLKPANVLLDEDTKPRLADFGQSRLSHEQSPALGTLFYMAPEQADLEAVPDARWDVYALGALLYSMLTGEPPYRTEEVTGKVEEATDLPDRLARYRSAISAAPRLTEHRKVTGVDRALADVVEQCLTINPKDRYSNVQAVLDALAARDEARARRPLMILGFVGPTLLLLVIAVFGWWVYDEAVSETDQSLTRKARESNAYAAQMAAETAGYQVRDYYQSVDAVANNPQFRRLLLEALESSELSSIRETLSDPNKNSQLMEQRQQFIDHPDRARLQTFIEELMRETNLPNAASWFVCDAQGTQLASAFAQETFSPTIGKNYSYRTYFHGGNADLAKESEANGKPLKVYSRPKPGQTIRETHLSAPFFSTGTGTWKVAFSTPIIEDGVFLGIAAVTVEMGEFVRFNNTDVQYVVLVDSRHGPYHGAILEHPLFEKHKKRNGGLPKEFSEYRVQLGRITKDEPWLRDPIGKHKVGAAYDKEWIAAIRKVRRPVGGGYVDTGLVVIGLEDREAVVAPAYALGKRLMRLGFWALVVVIAIALALWYLVVRSFRETQRRAAAMSSPLATGAPSLHSMKTLTAPHSPTK